MASEITQMGKREKGTTLSIREGTREATVNVGAAIPLKLGTWKGADTDAADRESVGWLLGSVQRRRLMFLMSTRKVKRNYKFQKNKNKMLYKNSWQKYKA